MATKRIAYRMVVRGGLIAAGAMLFCTIGWSLRGAESKADGSKPLQKLREEKMNDVEHWYESWRAAHEAGTATLESARECYIAWKDTALELAETKQDRIAALKQYRDRIKQIELGTEALYVAKQRGGEETTLWQHRYWVAQADTWIAEEEAKP